MESLLNKFSSMPLWLSTYMQVRPSERPSPTTTLYGNTASYLKLPSITQSAQGSGRGEERRGTDLVCRATHYSAKMWAMYKTKLNQWLERGLPKSQSLLSRHSNFSKSSTSHAMRKPPCESYPNSSSLCFNRTRNASLCKYSV